VTAPAVRADSDAHTVEITVPGAALEALLCRLAVDDVVLRDLLDDLASADRVANADLTVHDVSRDEAFNRRDAALAALLEELPAVVWRLSADGDAARLSEAIRGAGMQARGGAS